jgi:hypothetical protein
VLGPRVLGPRVLDPRVLGPRVLDPRVLGPRVLGPPILAAATLGRGAQIAAGQGRVVAGPRELSQMGLVALGTAARPGRNREPVVRIGPRRNLAGILASGLNLRRQRRQLVAAALADDREGLPVQREPERDLVWHACLVAARDRRYAEQRSIYAA